MALLPFLPLPVCAGWKNYEDADLVLGRQLLPGASTVLAPIDAAVSASGKVFIVDYGYNRVLRFSSAAALGNGQAAEAVFGQPDLVSAEPNVGDSGLNSPQGVEIDSAGNLWVVDVGNNRVLRWANADTAASGTAAVQVLGQDNFTNRGQSRTATGLAYPVAVDVDPSGRLWVADYFNNRIVRYDNAAAKGNGGAADALIGQTAFGTNTSGTSATELSSPHDVVVDAQGRLWVADLGNNRVLRFDSPVVPAAVASGVLAQVDFVTKSSGSGPDKMYRPISLAIGPNGSLYVGDDQNRRILRWDNAAGKANGSSSDGVLGRVSAQAGAADAAIQGLVSQGIRGLAVDAAGRLWAADTDSGRILRWDAAQLKANGAAADGVIGQATTSITARNSLNNAGVTAAYGGFEDPVSGKFFIADTGRVLRFSSRAAAEAGGNAEAYLGKPNNSTDYTSPSASTMIAAWGITMDSAGSLWVADPYANRVVSFPNAATAATGSAMGVVLGQATFNTGSAGLAANRLSEPRALAMDAAGNLYVCDYGNHRVLRFNSVKNKVTGANADAVIGQADLASASTAANDALLKNPSGICIDTQGRLWVADTGKNRVARYDSPLSMAATDLPSGFLGSVGSLTAIGMNQPISVAVTSNGRLWVMDYGYNRILRYDGAATKANGGPADGVLGSPNFTTSSLSGCSLRAFNRPQAIFLDANERLWVLDSNNYRALKFVPDCSASIIASGINVNGKFNLTYKGIAGATYEIRSSTNLKNWDLEGTVTSVDTNPHTFTDAKSGSKRFFRIEEP